MSETRIHLPEPERTNLLGLLMRGMLENRLADDRLAARARALRGDVRVQAGAMAIILRFGPEGLTILRDGEGEPSAWVRGTMNALLGLVTGGGLVAPVLSRRVRFGGNLLLLLRMLPLLTTTAAGAGRGPSQPPQARDT
jgi:hypothetical protein